MTSSGLVIDIKDNKALIRFIRESACGGNCASCGGCGAKPLDVWINNTLSVSVGEKVEIETESSKILLSAFITYIFPLLVFLSCYMIFTNTFGKTAGIISGVIGFLGSLIAVRLYGKRLKLDYKMLRRID